MIVYNPRLDRIEYEVLAYINGHVVYNCEGGEFSMPLRTFRLEVALLGLQVIDSNGLNRPF